jgi:glycerophosphoryl diester phosphodiesterase
MPWKWRSIVISLTAVLVSLYLLNASWMAMPPSGRPQIVAQRGLEQAYAVTEANDDSCTARSITPPAHDFIDNTLPSIAAALAEGADIVEIDVRTTRDRQFVLFHDYALDCRTDGTGLVSEHSLAELRRLDVGYGYTADGGRTFPLRGRGVGLMPTLAAVLRKFPEARFLIQIKDSDAAVADLLVSYLDAEQLEPWTRVTVFGSATPLRRLKQLKPRTGTWSDRAVASCLLGYLQTGWYGRVPHACDDGMIIVPIEQASLVWGWPNRFLARMREHRTQVMLIGKIHGVGSRSFSRLDTRKEFSKVPPGFDGLIWTDCIGVIGPLAGVRQPGRY